MLQGYRENTKPKVGTENKSKGGYSNTQTKVFSLSASYFPLNQHPSPRESRLPALWPAQLNESLTGWVGEKKYPCLLADKPLTFRVRDIIYHGKQLASNNPQWEIIGLMVTEENVLNEQRGEKSPTTGRICEPFQSWAGTLKQTSPVSVWHFYRALKCSASANSDMVNMLRAEVDRKTGREEGRVIFADGGWQQRRGWMLPELKRSAGCQRDITRSWEWLSLHTTGGAMQKKRLTSASLLTHWEIKVQGVFFRWEPNISSFLATSSTSQSERG